MNGSGPYAVSVAMMGGSARPFWRLTGIFLGLAVIVALPFLIWGEHFEALLGSDRLLGWFQEYRSTAWILVIGLLVSDLILPIPNTMVMAAAGAVYGPLLGGFVSVVGNCLSALLGYGLCCRFGRPIARRLLGEADLAAGEALFAKSGGPMVALSRWLPVVPEVISCMAGLGRMPLRAFLLALVCGSAPLGFTVAALGYAGSNRPILTLILCALLPLPIWYVLRRMGSAGS
jgi:uncharacterized membrane protein YdjX (TVP38/TMEM64 family)